MDKFIKIVESNKEYFKFPDHLQTLLINSETPIYYLEELKEVKKMYIKGDNEYDKIGTIDYSEINKFKNLQALFITNNPNIEKLDITNLTKLQTIIIVNNQSLYEIKGLDNLKDLKKIIIVGNNIKTIKNFNKFLKNNKNAKMIKLDINMYHYLDKLDIINMENINVSFAEKISVGQFYNLTLKMMNELYKKGLEITKKINTDNTYDILKQIYTYIIKTTTYDYEMLEMRNSYILEGKEISIYENNYKGCNSSYNALIKNKAVCEGYANALKFLANIKGKDIENIACLLKKQTTNHVYYNHTASRINIDGQWRYLDAQIETDVNNLKYFLLTTEQFEKTHRLLNEETKRIGVKK